MNFDHGKERFQIIYKCISRGFVTFNNNLLGNQLLAVKQTLRKISIDSDLDFSMTFAEKLSDR